jgi:hypothetical protein
MTKPLPFPNSPPIPLFGDVVAFQRSTPRPISGANPECHGLILTGEGGLALMAEGAGFMVLLSPETLRMLSSIAAGVADQVEAAREAIKARADQALEKVISEYPLHALPRESFGNA